MTPQEEIGKYFEVCGFAPDDTVSVVWKGRSGALGWTNVPVSEAYKVIDGHRLVDTWISANPMTEPEDKNSRGTAADVYAVRALWADLDVGPGKLESFAAARAVIAEVSELIGAQPVVLVASGHGLQPRWRLEAPNEVLDENRQLAAEILERFGRIVQTVAERHGGKADSVYDLPRIIRAPGTTNCKSKPHVPVLVKFTGSTDVVNVETVIGLFDTFAPPETPKGVAPKAENVDLSRGDRYVRSVLSYLKEELDGIRDWPVGKTDDRGRGWEKIQADAAFRLAELAKADWNSLTEQQAQKIFGDYAPTDSDWTIRDVIKKWKSQWPRAQAAEPPAVVDDPLAPGYEASGRAGGDVHTHHSAPAAAEGESGVSGAGHRSDPLVGEPARGGEVGGSPGSTTPDPSRSWHKYPWTDRGNAERIIDLYGSELRWSPGLKRWLRYCDGAWREDETGGETVALEMLDRLKELEAGLYSDVDVPIGRGKVQNERADFLKWIREQHSAAKYTAAAKTLRFTKRLNAEASAFDTEPMLLNAPNGIIDLYSGELLEHDPSLMLRRQIPVPYDPKAKAPRWDAFLERVMPSPDMRDYLQRVIGYTLTGRTTEQVVFFHVGPPASGKSVFLRIMESILGEFSRVVPPTTLLNKKMEQHPTDVMGMEGRRMLQVSETPEGARLDESLVKRLSGEETITARGMGENFRDFRIVGKVHLVTNHDPRISDDPAVHRRLHYIPWTQHIAEGARDPMLAEDIIREELPGVLAWAVRGSLRWAQDRLKRPVEAEMARAEYLAAEDEFSQFMDDELILGATNSFTPTTDIRSRYVEWSRERGFNAEKVSVHAITKRMKARGHDQVRTERSRGFGVLLQAPKWARDPLA